MWPCVCASWLPNSSLCSESQHRCGLHTLMLHLKLHKLSPPKCTCECMQRQVWGEWWVVHFHMKSAGLEVGLALLVGQLHLSVLHCCSASEESRLTFPAVTWWTCSHTGPTSWQWSEHSQGSADLCLHQQLLTTHRTVFKLCLFISRSQLAQVCCPSSTGGMVPPPGNYPMARRIHLQASVLRQPQACLL